MAHAAVAAEEDVVVETPGADAAVGGGEAAERDRETAAAAEAQSPEVVAVVGSWLPGEAGHDGGPTWAVLVGYKTAVWLRAACDSLDISKEERIAT